MRFSEGVKRYQKDTKRKIFDEIIAAAERENTADISQKNTTDNRKTEKISMNKKETDGIARIRSNKSGLIAAACAVAVVGGGLFAMDKLGGSKIMPGSETSSLTTDAEDSISTDGNENKKDGTAEKKTDGVQSTVSEAEVLPDDSTGTDDSENKENGTAEKKKEDVHSTISLVEVLPDDDNRWRDEGATDDLKRLESEADFIGEVTLGEMTETDIGGLKFADFICNIRRSDGAIGTVMKYSGGDLNGEIHLLLPYDENNSNVKSGESILVWAKAEKSENGIVLRAIDDIAVFMFQNSEYHHGYVNIFKSGHVGDNDTNVNEITGNYVYGLYEWETDEYVNDRIASCVINNNDPTYIEKWCNFNGIVYRYYEVPREESEPFSIGDIMGISYFSGDKVSGQPFFDGIVVTVCDGHTYKDPTDLYIMLDSESSSNIDWGFEGYEIWLSDLYYDTGSSSLFIGVSASLTESDMKDHVISFNLENTDEVKKVTGADQVLGIGCTSPDTLTATSYLQVSGIDLESIGPDKKIVLNVNTISDNGNETEGSCTVSFTINNSEITE